MRSILLSSDYSYQVDGLRNFDKSFLVDGLGLLQIRSRLEFFKLFHEAILRELSTLNVLNIIVWK